MTEALLQKIVDIGFGLGVSMLPYAIPLTLVVFIVGIAASQTLRKSEKKGPGSNCRWMNSMSMNFTDRFPLHHLSELNKCVLEKVKKGPGSNCRWMNSMSMNSTDRFPLHHLSELNKCVLTFPEAWP